MRRDWSAAIVGWFAIGVRGQPSICSVIEADRLSGFSDQVAVQSDISGRWILSDTAS